MPEKACIKRNILKKKISHPKEAYLHMYKKIMQTELETWSVELSHKPIIYSFLFMFTKD